LHQLRIIVGLAVWFSFAHQPDAQCPEFVSNLLAGLRGGERHGSGSEGGATQQSEQQGAGKWAGFLIPELLT